MGQLEVDSRQLRLFAALHRVNKQVATWDLIDALELVPNTLQSDVEIPVLDREQLKGLQVELVEAIRELELLSGRP